MPYSANSDLLKEMSSSELAILTGDPTGLWIDTVRTDFARHSADLLIDTYLADKYDVPYEGLPDPVINVLSADLTLCILYDYAYRNSTVPYAVIERRKKAMKLLNDLREGLATIKTPILSERLPDTIYSNLSSDKTFGEETLTQFLE